MPKFSVTSFSELRMPTLPRRKSDPSDRGRTHLRSSLADAAWAVEDRVVWGTADLFRALFDAAKLPFERIAGAVEHRVVWPIREETALWSRPVRAMALAAVLLLAGAGVAAGVIVSDPSAGDAESDGLEVVRVSTPDESLPPPVPTTPSAKAEAATGGAVLQDTSPELATEQGGGITKAQAATEPPASHVAAGTSSAADVAATPAEPPAQSGRRPRPRRRPPRRDRGRAQVLRRLRPL